METLPPSLSLCLSLQSSVCLKPTQRWMHGNNLGISKLDFAFSFQTRVCWVLSLPFRVRLASAVATTATLLLASPHWGDDKCYILWQSCPSSSQQRCVVSSDLFLWQHGGHERNVDCVKRITLCDIDLLI